VSLRCSDYRKGYFSFPPEEYLKNTQEENNITYHFSYLFLSFFPLPGNAEKREEGEQDSEKAVRGV
jgi:hypothetical protein